jgi:hypothetical protein
MTFLPHHRCASGTAPRSRKRRYPRVDRADAAGLASTLAAINTRQAAADNQTLARTWSPNPRGLSEAQTAKLVALIDAYKLQADSALGLQGWDALRRLQPADPVLALFLSQQLALDTEPNRAGAALLAANVPRPFDAVLAAWKADGYSLGFDLFAAAGLDQVAVAAVRAVPCVWLNQTVGYWAFVRLQAFGVPAKLADSVTG